MLNVIWVLMMVLAAVFAIINNRVDEVVQSIPIQAKLAFDMALSLGGMMALWLGLMKVAEDAGLISKLVLLLRPVMRRLFPSVPEEHPAMGAMVMNFISNMLGLNNASTPFGLRAMKELQTLNNNSDVASDDMCLFIAINASSIQLIPTTAIAILTTAHGSNPTNIIMTTLLATTCTTVISISVCFLYRYKNKRRKLRA